MPPSRSRRAWCSLPSSARVSPRTGLSSSRTRSGSATERIAFPEFIKSAYGSRIQLSAAGFYKTPKIHWNRAEGRGRPFFYFAYGASCSEVSIDTLTGEYQVDRTDVLHDVGKSLNPALDIGQVEGAFVQGMGWLTTEELWWDAKGRLRTHAPSTYKIPLASDRPRTFNVNLAELVGQPRGNDPPLQGRRRAAIHAGDLRAGGDLDGGRQRCGLSYFAASRCAGNARTRVDGDRTVAVGAARSGEIAMATNRDDIRDFLNRREPVVLVEVKARRRLDAARRRCLDAGGRGLHLRHHRRWAARIYGDRPRTPGPRTGRPGGRNERSRSVRKSASAAVAASACASSGLTEVWP